MSNQLRTIAIMTRWSLSHKTGVVIGAVANINHQNACQKRPKDFLTFVQV